MCCKYDGMGTKVTAIKKAKFEFDSLAMVENSLITSLSWNKYVSNILR